MRMLASIGVTVVSIWRRRDAPLDPLLFAAAIAAGPHVTRHHYHHDFLPVTLDDPDGNGEDLDWTGLGIEEAVGIDIDPPPKYVSKQAPRSQRLLGGEGKVMRSKNENAEVLSTPSDEAILRHATNEKTESKSNTHPAISFTPPPFDTTNPNVQVQCLSRARIPTPYGPAFLHLYRNNRDDKEHLAIVVDPAQLDPIPNTSTSATASALPPPIRSRTLDATWNSAESETDRIVRGAYVGRLTPSLHTPSNEPAHTAAEKLGIHASPSPAAASATIPAPLVRIHSECFTGETIGSMRCDCGEQLDEALRLISLPLPAANPNASIPGRGVIVYMRQEGRGIGLLSKLRAYNLQDMGHDTVTANLMLGHGADERGYEVAAAILKDLGLGDPDGVRLLTNNPAKVRALESEGVRIVERVAMVPRSWQSSKPRDGDGERTRGGVTLIAAAAAHGDDLDKYLRTKVDKMGHMLTIPN
ncbi:GTP cyclohydrolase II-domain-containing protein [Hysterangium stoloniferum]|nr:GTP cyclohydrolase II-domain-containing protein [Hysterangium stoloniferum]